MPTSIRNTVFDVIGTEFKSLLKFSQYARLKSKNFRFIFFDLGLEVSSKVIPKWSEEQILFFDIFDKKMV